MRTTCKNCGDELLSGEIRYCSLCRRGRDTTPELTSDPEFMSEESYNELYPEGLTQ